MKEPSALVERSEDLAQLERALGAAARGDGTSVLLCGPAGIGKTALLGRLCAHAKTRGFLALAATASELEHGFPYAVVRQLYEGTLSRTERLADERSLTGAARAAAAVFDSGELSSKIGSDVSFAVMHGLYWLMSDLSERSPLLIAVDDVQWSDAASLRHLLYAARRLEGLPVALVLAQRDGEPLDRPLEELGELSSRIDLGPLSTAGVAELLTAALGEAPSSAFLSACHERTGGNPLYVTAFAREVIDRDVAVDGIAVAELEDGIASRLAAYVRRRVEVCGPRAGTVAGLVAVLDRDSRASRIAELAQMPRAQVDDLLSRLVERDVLGRGEPVRFSHPVVRGIVHRGLRSTERDEWHRGAAKLIERDAGDVSEISAHLQECLPSGDAWVAERLRAAARHAFAQGAPESAVIALRRAIEEPPPEALRTRMLRELANAEHATGESESALERLAVASALAPDGREQAEIAIEQAGILAVTGRYRLAVDALDRGLRALGDCDEDAGNALEQRLDAELISYALIDDASRERGLTRLARYEGRVPDGPAAQAALTAMAVGAMLTDQKAEVVCDLAARALEASDLRARHFGEELWSAAAWTLIMADRPLQAYEIAADELPGVRSGGDVRKLGVVEIVLAYAALRLGQIPEAVARSQTVLEVTDWGIQENWASSVQVLGLIEAGELDEAERVLVQTPEEWWSADVTGSYLLLEARVSLDLALGRLAAAHEPLAELERRALALGPTMRYCDDIRFCQGALLAHREGDVERARSLAERGLEAARGLDSARAVGQALRVAGLVGATERPTIELLEASVAMLEESSFALERARSLVELGSALRRAGRRTDARNPLGRGMEIAFRSGAGPIVTRATEELHACGARPRRFVRSGVDALTATELRVASLVAEGRSNREVAQDMYVTLRQLKGTSDASTVSSTSPDVPPARSYPTCSQGRTAAHVEQLPHRASPFRQNQSGPDALRDRDRHAHTWSRALT